jgi:hypothetical protein
MPRQNYVIIHSAESQLHEPAISGHIELADLRIRRTRCGRFQLSYEPQTAGKVSQLCDLRIRLI